MENGKPNDGKTAAILSYILIVGVLIAMSINAEEKIKSEANDDDDLVQESSNLNAFAQE